MTKTKALQLLLILGTVVWVKADYHIGFTISGYSSPSNTLFNGSSCTPAGGCRTTLRLCFRDAGHSHGDVASSCLATINRENPNLHIANAVNEPVIPEYYSQQFQVYIRVSHSLEENRELANFNPPFTDPLIDDIFIEADVTAVLFDAQFVNSEMYTVTGDFGVATLTLALNVRCALNYFGSSCEMLCDSSGENCATVRTPPPPVTMTTDDDPTSDTTDDPTGDTTNQPSVGPTAGMMVRTPDIVGIVVGVVVGVTVLVCIGVIVVVLIVFLVKRSRKGSWNPKRTSTPQFSLERTERNLTSNINRISIISDSGEEVQYAVVSKPNSPARTPRRTPSPPPPYVPPMKTELTSEDEEGPKEVATGRRDMVLANKEASAIAGYEVMDFDNPKPKEQETNPDDTELRYISLDIHTGSNGRPQLHKVKIDKDDANHEPVKYSEVRHDDP